MPVEFPALPYDMDALVPHVSARTLEYHYGKHHRGYVDKLNVAGAGSTVNTCAVIRTHYSTLEGFKHDYRAKDMDPYAYEYNGGFVYRHPFHPDEEDYYKRGLKF